jgi:hypothetical protein
MTGWSHLLWLGLLFDMACLALFAWFAYPAPVMDEDAA